MKLLIMDCYGVGADGIRGDGLLDFDISGEAACFNGVDFLTVGLSS
jgi:hypothetical protein